MSRLTYTFLFVGFVAAIGYFAAGAMAQRGFPGGPIYGFSGIGLPAEKADYAGQWRAPDHVLAISPSGKVRYEGKEGHVSTKLDLPIQKFDGDSFVVGLLFWRTTFKVAAPPHREEDGWHMTSDGVEYRR
jgi:hypothetical protein